MVMRLALRLRSRSAGTAVRPVVYGLRVVGEVAVGEKMCRRALSRGRGLR
jgi:hypothetical protein